MVQRGKQATLDGFFKVRSDEDGSKGMQEQHGEAGLDPHPCEGLHAVDDEEGPVSGRPGPVASDSVASAAVSDMMVDAAAD